MSRNYGTAGPGPSPLQPSGEGFSPTELYTLVEAAASGVTAVQAASRQLERTERHLGSPRDTEALRSQAQETQQSVNTTVSATTRDLRRLEVIVRKGDKRQKLQFEKLAQNFSESVVRYSQVQKQLSEKMQLYMPPKVPMTDFTAEGNAHVEDDDTVRLLALKQTQAQMLEFDNGLLGEREEYVRQIESNVLDINQVMQELSAIINCQGSTIDTIESSIEGAEARVETGREELVKASRYQAKFRRKMLILLTIALVAGIVLTIIIVTSLKR